MLIFKYKKFLKLKKVWQWYNKRNCKEINENYDVVSANEDEIYHNK